MFLWVVLSLTYEFDCISVTVCFFWMFISRFILLDHLCWLWCGVLLIRWFEGVFFWAFFSPRRWVIKVWMSGICGCFLVPSFCLIWFTMNREHPKICLFFFFFLNFLVLKIWFLLFILFFPSGSVCLRFGGSVETRSCICFTVMEDVFIWVGSLHFMCKLSVGLKEIYRFFFFLKFYLSFWWSLWAGASNETLKKFCKASFEV